MSNWDAKRTCIVIVVLATVPDEKDWDQIDEGRGEAEPCAKQGERLIYTCGFVRRERSEGSRARTF